MEDHSSEVQWQCELQTADAEQAGVRFVTVEGLDGVDLDAKAVSGRTTLFTDGAVIVNGSLKIPKGGRKNWDKIEKRGPAEKTKQKQGNNKSKGKGNADGNGKEKRQLAPLVDESLHLSVLAVRIKAPDSVTSADVATLSNDIFGTAGSQVNLKERFDACSHGEVQIDPFNGKTPTGISIQGGVVEVEIDTTNVIGVVGATVRNAVVAKLQDYLGYPDLSDQFDHVMLCLPPGTSGSWIAYGKFLFLLHIIHC